MCNPTIAITINSETLPLIHNSGYDWPTTEDFNKIFIIVNAQSKFEVSKIMTREDAEKLYDRKLSDLLNWQFITD